MDHCCIYCFNTCLPATRLTPVAPKQHCADTDIQFGLRITANTWFTMLLQLPAHAALRAAVQLVPIPVDALLRPRPTTLQRRVGSASYPTRPTPGSCILWTALRSHLPPDVDSTPCRGFAGYALNMLARCTMDMIPCSTLPLPRFLLRTCVPGRLQQQRCTRFVPQL